LLLAGAFAALSFSLRYPGVFFVASIGLWYFVAFIAIRTKRSFLELLAVIVIPAATMFVIFYRNFAITGSLTGTGLATGDTSITQFLLEFVWAVAKLFGASDWGILAPMVTAAIIATILASAVPFVALRRGRLVDYFGGDPQLRAPMLSLSYIVVSFIGLAVLSLTAAAGYMNDRYLLPLLPFLIIWMAYAFRCASARWPDVHERILVKAVVATAFTFLIVGQLGVWQREWQWYQSDERVAVIGAALAEEWGDGSVYDYLRLRTSNRSPILAPNGQYLGMLLDRPVIGLAAPLYTNRVWDESTVWGLVESYNVAHVVLFPALFDVSSAWDSNREFFADLESGITPDWLKPVYQGENVVIYKAVGGPKEIHHE
jgi:hypothetical protein